MSIIDPTPILPDTEELQKSVIGCCLIGGLPSTQNAAGSLPDDAFTIPEIRASWLVLKKQAEVGDPIDPILFAQAYRKEHKAMPNEALATQDLVPSAANLPYYIEALSEAHQKAVAITAADRIKTGLVNGSMDASRADADFAEMLFNPAADDAQVLTNKQIANNALDRIQQRFDDAKSGKHNALLTKLHAFDHSVDGFRQGELVLIGARPSVGKSALMVTLIRNMCIEQNIPTLVFSAEMSAQALTDRLVACLQGVSLRMIRTMKDATERDISDIFRGLEKIKKAPLRIIDGSAGLTSERIRAITQRQQRRSPAKLVFVDYAQKIRTEKKVRDRLQQVNEVSEAFQAIARRENVCLVALAQLRRDVDQRNGLPGLADFADSSQLEKDADVAMLLHRDQQEGSRSNDATLLWPKVRDGETGGTCLTFRGQFSEFCSSPADVPVHTGTRQGEFGAEVAL